MHSFLSHYVPRSNWYFIERSFALRFLMNHCHQGIGLTRSILFWFRFLFFLFFSLFFFLVFLTFYFYRIESVSSVFINHHTDGHRNEKLRCEAWEEMRTGKMTTTKRPPPPPQECDLTMFDAWQITEIGNFMPRIYSSNITTPTPFSVDWDCHRFFSSFFASFFFVLLLLSMHYMRRWWLICNIINSCSGSETIFTCFTQTKLLPLIYCAIAFCAPNCRISQKLYAKFHEFTCL